MKRVVFYAIAYKKDKLLLFERDGKRVDVCCWDDVRDATLFSSKEEAVSTLKELTGQKPKEFGYHFWDFQKCDMIESNLSIVKVSVSFKESEE